LCGSGWSGNWKGWAHPHTALMSNFCAIPRIKRPMRKLSGIEFRTGAAPTSCMKPECSLNWNQVSLALGVHFSFIGNNLIATHPQNFTIHEDVQTKPRQWRLAS